jgi:hypothetical protein
VLGTTEVLSFNRIKVSSVYWIIADIVLEIESGGQPL